MSVSNVESNERKKQLMLRMEELINIEGFIRDEVEHQILGNYKRGIVEVVEPQNLRERLRVAAEELAVRYMNGDGDKYNEALRKSENNGDLDLTGIHVKNRTQHYKLYLKTLTLSDNDVADISFVKNYERLNIIKLFNNPITDLSPLSTCDKTHTL